MVNKRVTIECSCFVSGVHICVRVWGCSWHVYVMCLCVYMCVCTHVPVYVMCLCVCVCIHVHVWYACLCKYVCAYTHMWKPEAEASCLFLSFFTLFSWDPLNKTFSWAGWSGNYPDPPVCPPTLGLEVCAAMHGFLRGSLEFRLKSSCPWLFWVSMLWFQIHFPWQNTTALHLPFQEHFHGDKIPISDNSPILSWYLVGFVLFRLVQPK